MHDDKISPLISKAYTECVCKVYVIFCWSTSMSSPVTSPTLAFPITLNSEIAYLA